MLGRMAEENVLLSGRCALACIREVPEQDREPFGVLGVVAGRVEARERRVRQDVDWTISANSSSEATPGRARPSR